MLIFDAASLSCFSPDTQSYIDKMKHDEERARGQQGDNHSFFGKYVSHLLSAFLSLVFMVFSPLLFICHWRTPNGHLRM